MEFSTPTFDKPNYENYKLSDFRDLVGDLVKNSETLKDKVIAVGNNGIKINILDAIENKGLSEYADGANDRTLDAINCLIEIYDELKKDTPNGDFIEQTIEDLKEYL